MNKQKEKLAITLFKPKVHTLQECLSDYEIEKRATIKPQFELEGEVIIEGKTRSEVATKQAMPTRMTQRRRPFLVLIRR